MNFNDQSKTRSWVDQQKFYEIMPNNDLKKASLSKQQIERLRSIARDINGKKSLVERGQPHIDSPGKCTLVLFLSSNKTLYPSASLVLANELTRKAYRIDLSTLVNKFISETEKTLNCVFKNADNKNWILLFDEADALFGGRKEEEDSHNRNDNKITECFLRCLEAFNGIVILAANHKNVLDSALIRRVNHIMDFLDSAKLPTDQKKKPATDDNDK